MTPRKAAVLAAQLPAGAQTWQSVGNDAAWTAEAHLAATVFDAVQVGNWQRAGDSKSKPPTPLRRPSQAREDAHKVDRMAERARAFKERQDAVLAQQPTQPRDARGRFVKEA